mgnify:CR=1 FL=1
MSAIFLRGSLFLNERYHWTHIPHLFPEWQTEDVLGLAMGFPDRPDGYAMVSGDVIDLDALDVVRLSAFAENGLTNES